MKLLDQVRQVARVRHLARRTEDCYTYWAERYIRFHRTPDGFQHPNTLGAPHLEAFLTDLAVTHHVSASTQNQALAAVLFLYRGTTMIYTHVLARGPAGALSPLDQLSPQPVPAG